MRLPNADFAIIARSKLSDYLLNLEHEDGSGKAKFFMSFGFGPQAPDVLRQALLVLAREADIAEIQHSPNGVKYVVIGSLRAPDGSSPVVKTVWMIDAGSTAPRLITAFPGTRPST